MDTFLVDFVAYCMFFVALWCIKDSYDSRVSIITKTGFALLFALVVILTCFYTYATIGLDLAEIIGRSYSL